MAGRYWQGHTLRINHYQSRGRRVDTTVDLLNYMLAEGLTRRVGILPFFNAWTQHIWTFPALASTSNLSSCLTILFVAEQVNPLFLQAFIVICGRITKRVIEARRWSFERARFYCDNSDIFVDGNQLLFSCVGSVWLDYLTYLRKVGSLRVASTIDKASVVRMRHFQ